MIQQSLGLGQSSSLTSCFRLPRQTKMHLFEWCIQTLVHERFFQQWLTAMSKCFSTELHDVLLSRAPTPGHCLHAGHLYSGHQNIHQRLCLCLQGTAVPSSPGPPSRMVRSRWSQSHPCTYHPQVLVILCALPRNASSLTGLYTK